jgi:hypothetical protein
MTLRDGDEAKRTRCSYLIMPWRRRGLGGKLRLRPVCDLTVSRVTQQQHAAAAAASGVLCSVCSVCTLLDETR